MRLDCGWRCGWQLEYYVEGKIDVGVPFLPDADERRLEGSPPRLFQVTKVAENQNG